MGNNIRSSSRPKALAPSIPMPPLADAMDAVHLSVDRFCLLAGVEALAEMMEEDATTVCGARHRRHGDRRGYRWGRTHSEIGYHGGKVKVARPRVRDRAGKEVSLESWQALRDGNLLLEWALNLMVLNVSTRKYHRAVRLPEGDLAKARGDGTSKSAVSRRFVALSRKKMKAWLASDLSELDLLVHRLSQSRHRGNLIPNTKQRVAPAHGESFVWIGALVQCFRGSNHIRRPRLVCRTRCGRRDVG